MAATWQFIGTTIGGYKLLTANKDEKFWKNKEKWETVQYFAKQGIKATKEGWERDCFCLSKSPNVASHMSLFEKIKPIHHEWIDNIEKSKSVRQSKKAQKKYNLKRKKVRESHWDMLMKEYIECESSDDYKLKVKDLYRNLYVTEQPVDDETNRNNWRQYSLFFGCTVQMFLVVIALLSGIYSYLAVAKDIETEVAVKVGLDVLKNVSLTGWAGFIVFNIVVLVYYWTSCWDSLLSWTRTLTSVLGMLGRCCVSRRNQKLETVFKPTWTHTVKTTEV